MFIYTHENWLLLDLTSAVVVLHICSLSLMNGSANSSDASGSEHPVDVIMSRSTRAADVHKKPTVIISTFSSNENKHDTVSGCTVHFVFNPHDNYEEKANDTR